jgi:hypothetical protein
MCDDSSDLLRWVELSPEEEDVYVCRRCEKILKKKRGGEDGKV